MITAFIIDDEALSRKLIASYLKDYPSIHVIGEYSNGFDAFKGITELKPQLLFLDIQMPKISGLELIELFEDDIPEIIFITAFDEYAVKAFEANAIDYILKPFTKERFDKAIKKALDRINLKNHSETNALSTLVVSQQTDRIVVKNGHQIKIIPNNQIHYIEAYDDYVKLHHTEGLSVKKQTLTSIENKLSPKDFVRIHRSYIIKLDQIQKIELNEKGSYCVILKNKTILPVSKNGYQVLKKQLEL
jgi:two-component system LytT family response regulator